ncbi:MAG TPA: hypothetical protein VNS46_19205 [Nocardioides sp.]|nr:hypothetical protein [Nocardioides sp.]
MTTAGQAQRRRERWRATSALVGAVVLVVAFGIQLILLIPTTFTATSAIALRPLSAEVSAESVELLAHEYGVAMGARETAVDVRSRTDSSGSSADVAVNTVQDPGTATLRIVVSSTSRQMALDVANGLAERGVELGKDDPIAQVVLVVEANAEGVSSDPPRRFYISALLCLAVLVLAGGLYRIRERSS